MVTRFLERRAVSMMSRRARRAERGSQSLEWVALGGHVVTGIGAATRVAGGDGFGADVANAIFHPIKDMLAPQK
jgi:hypothetical protein